MTAKQLVGLHTADGAKYATVTDGSGNLKTLNSAAGSAKQARGATAPDGSAYFTLTDGNGTLR